MIRIVIFIIAGIAFVYVAATKLADLPMPDIQPDSNIYFLDNLAERMKLLAIKNPDEKLGKLLEYSDEKLNEIKYVADSEENRKLLEKVLPKHEKYIKEALDEIEKMKKDETEESQVSGSSWASGVGDRVLEKKEVLSEILNNVSEEEQSVIEEEIKKTEVVIQRIIEQVEGPIKEIIIYKTENTDEAIEDKQEEEHAQQEQEEKETLSETERLYYIWIDSLYAKTLPKENEPFFARTHIRRRDNECKFFSGKIVLNINGNEWQSIIAQMQPSDDLWRDLGPIELLAGTYTVEEKLLDNNGQIISTKEFVMIVE
ncbi:MAG: hypothetical protein U9P90_01330 [Patescibacteria group bacterium]|nr:hypothetical protein [Patescibacteria group bacterium]